MKDNEKSMNANYVKHVWQDHEKVNNLAFELMKKLDLESERKFNEWRLEDGKFCIVIDDYDCGGCSIWYFPVEWLDYDVEKICELCRVEKEKTGSKLVGWM